MPIRFAAVGLNHSHIYIMVDQLLEAGATLHCFYAEEENLTRDFIQKYPSTPRARSIDAVLQDDMIDVVVSAAIPNERAALGMVAMRHGKDYIVDKPGFTALNQLEAVRRVQAETKQIYSVHFTERFASPSTIKASELVQAGAIGQVIHTIGLGPHRLGLFQRPDWFYKRDAYGGILADIASHQVDQFLHFTNSTSAEIVSAQVANHNHPQYPELEDFGDLTLRSEKATGYIRVDWFTPDGLGAWGDGRLFLLGTEGYIELRKVIDIAGRGGGDHLFLVNGDGEQYIDCTDVVLPYGTQIVQDVQNRTETAMTQEHCFTTSEIALRAQAMATRLGHLLT